MISPLVVPPDRRPAVAAVYRALSLGLGRRPLLRRALGFFLLQRDPTINAPGATAVGSQREQATANREVLHELDRLELSLARVDELPEVVEVERGCGKEGEQEKGPDSRPRPQGHREAAEEEQTDRAEEGELRDRDALRGHVGGGGRELQHLVGHGAGEHCGDHQSREQRHRPLHHVGHLLHHTTPHPERKPLSWSPTDGDGARPKTRGIQAVWSRVTQWMAPRPRIRAVQSKGSTWRPGKTD